MTGSFNFWDKEVWTFVVELSILLGSMLFANLLRRRIPFLRKSLMPSAVLGGFIALFADAAYTAVFSQPLFSLNTLEAITYHGLGLGFVALSWRHMDGVRGKKARRDVFSTSTVTVGSYLLQAVIGLAVTIPLFYLVGSFAAGGILLPMGYGQGPGQAFNWGTTYENQYGFVNGASFGLTVAAMGFVSASVGGVYYLNKMRRAGDPRAQREDAESIEDLTAEQITNKNEIPLSESMDKLTVQFGFVFMTYFVAYASMWALQKYIFEPVGGFLLNTVSPLVWGFNFLVGTAWAILFKSISDKLRKKGIMKREYTNNFMLNRISGLMCDLMVVASIAAINLSAFRYKEFWIPLALICVLGCVITYYYNLWVCRRLFPDYPDESFLALYGMLTGTASTGVILLREIDPLFKTPASHNLIYQNLWSKILGAPMLLLLGFVARSMTWTWITFAIVIVLFLLILLLQIMLSGGWNPKKKGEAAQ